MFNYFVTSGAKFRIAETLYKMLIGGTRQPEGWLGDIPK